MIRGVIFDIDGTLIDSMSFWDDLGARYLMSIGVEPEADLGQVLFTMSLEQGAAYMKEHYALSSSEEEIRAGVLGVIDHFYRKEVPLKPGMREIVEDYHRRSIPMTLATTSDKELVTAALTRLGLFGYFDRLYTATELKTNKQEPRIYQEAARSMGTSPEETAVYEDVLHAIKTAHDAGFYTIAVYDAASDKDWEAIQQLADECVDRRPL